MVSNVKAPKVKVELKNQEQTHTLEAKTKPRKLPSITPSPLDYWQATPVASYVTPNACGYGVVSMKVRVHKIQISLFPHTTTSVQRWKS